MLPYCAWHKGRVVDFKPFKYHHSVGKPVVTQLFRPGASPAQAHQLRLASTTTHSGQNDTFLTHKKSTKCLAQKLIFTSFEALKNKFSVPF